MQHILIGEYRTSIHQQVEQIIAESWKLTDNFIKQYTHKCQVSYGDTKKLRKHVWHRYLCPMSNTSLCQSCHNQYLWLMLVTNQYLHNVYFPFLLSCQLEACCRQHIWLMGCGYETMQVSHTRYSNITVCWSYYYLKHEFEDAVVNENKIILV